MLQAGIDVRSGLEALWAAHGLPVPPQTSRSSVELFQGALCQQRWLAASLPAWLSHSRTTSSGAVCLPGEGLQSSQISSTLGTPCRSPPACLQPLLPGQDGLAALRWELRGKAARLDTARLLPPVCSCEESQKGISNLFLTLFFFNLSPTLARFPTERGDQKQTQRREPQRCLVWGGGPQRNALSAKPACCGSRAQDPASAGRCGGFGEPESSVCVL